MQLPQGMPVPAQADLLLCLHEIFSRVFGREDIDITLLNGAGVLLRYRVLLEGVLLYGQRRCFVEFSIKARRDYLDMKPVFDFYHAHFMQGQRGDGLVNITAPSGAG